MAYSIRDWVSCGMGIYSMYVTPLEHLERQWVSMGLGFGHWAFSDPIRESRDVYYRLKDTAMRTPGHHR